MPLPLERLFEKKLPGTSQNGCGEEDGEVSHNACVTRCGKYVCAGPLPRDMLNDFKRIESTPPLPDLWSRRSGKPPAKIAMRPDSPAWWG